MINVLELKASLRCSYIKKRVNCSSVW